MKNERLTGLRELHKITQEQLAENVGVSQSMIARIETGDREPRRKIKVRIARYFNVSVEWLFYEQEYDQRSCKPTGTEG